LANPLERLNNTDHAVTIVGPGSADLLQGAQGAASLACPETTVLVGWRPMAQFECLEQLQWDGARENSRRRVFTRSIHD